jgi:hypothetical protein
MSAVPLFDGHKGRRCKRGPSRLRRLAAGLWMPLRAVLAGFELRLHWWDWAPVRAHWYRQYRRADRKAFAAEMAARVAAVAPIVTEVREGWERLADEMTGEWPETAAVAGEHPYPPLPVTLPRPDGIVRIDEHGHVTVHRPAPVVHPTLHDQPVVPAYAPPVYGEAPQLVVEPDLAKVMLP